MGTNDWLNSRDGEKKRFGKGLRLTWGLENPPVIFLLNQYISQNSPGLRKLQGTLPARKVVKT